MQCKMYPMGGDVSSPTSSVAQPAIMMTDRRILNFIFLNPLTVIFIPIVIAFWLRFRRNPTFPFNPTPTRVRLGHLSFYPSAVNNTIFF